MSPYVKFIVKTLSPRLLAKALVTIDKSTAVVVGACWAAAVVMLILATYAVHAAVVAGKEATEAAAAEPVLPVMTTTNMGVADIRAVAERIQRQFPDLKIEVDGSQALIVKSDDGGKFHEWVTALSYIDSVSPHNRWTFREMCVGRCGSGLMRAVITGQKPVFSLPAK